MILGVFTHREWACLDGTGAAACLLVKRMSTPRDVFCAREECGAGQEGL